MVINGEKSVIYGLNKIASLNNFSISTTPDDYQLFTKDGVIESYDANDKMFAKETGKCVNNDKKSNIFIKAEANDFDINTLTDTSLTVLATDTIKFNNGQKRVLVPATFAGVTNENTKSVIIGFKMISKRFLFI